MQKVFMSTRIQLSELLLNLIWIVIILSQEQGNFWRIWKTKLCVWTHFWVQNIFLKRSSCFRQVKTWRGANQKVFLWALTPPSFLTNFSDSTQVESSSKPLQRQILTLSIISSCCVPFKPSSCLTTSSTILAHSLRNLGKASKKKVILSLWGLTPPKNW